MTVTALTDNRRPHADESEGSELTVVGVRTRYAESMPQIIRCSCVAVQCHSRLPLSTGSCGVATKAEFHSRRGTDRHRKIARRDYLWVRDENIDLHFPRCGMMLVPASTSPNMEGYLLYAYLEWRRLVTLV